MQNDINIDFTDYQTILAHKGKIDGRVGCCKSADFMTNLDEEFKTSLAPNVPVGSVYYIIISIKKSKRLTKHTMCVKIFKKGKRWAHYRKKYERMYISTRLQKKKLRRYLKCTGWGLVRRLIFF